MPRVPLKNPTHGPLTAMAAVHVPAVRHFRSRRAAGFFSYIRLELLTYGGLCQFHQPPGILQMLHVMLARVTREAVNLQALLPTLR